MNRRRFLATTLAAAAGLALDPEKLLWVPGRKTIFIPPVKDPYFTTQIVAVLDRLLTQNEMMILFNEGSGLTFSELTGAEWNLKWGDDRYDLPSRPAAFRHTPESQTFD